jgi:hypothetical protein
MKKILSILIALFLLGSCSDKLTIKKLNYLAKENFKRELENELALNEEYIKGFPERKKEIEENERFFFENRIKIRNKVIDSLDILKNDNLIIIDKVGDYNGQRKEVSYLFFDNKIIEAKYETKYGAKEIAIIEELTEQKFSDSYKTEILEIYNFFNDNDLKNSKSTFDCSSSITKSYYITVALKTKVNYYYLLRDDKCNVSKLN